jgi:hypothetical protein
MYPIHNLMESFIQQIKEKIMKKTLVPFENLLINLLFEFPHPGDSFLVQSHFWKRNMKSARSNTFDFEDSSMQRY